MPGRDARDAPSSRPVRWSVGDVVDFETLIQREPAVSEADVAAWRSTIAGADARHRESRAVFLDWLAFARSRDATVAPGTIYARGRRIVTLLVVVLGLASGVGLCGALLSHGDATPVNALLFFGATVGVQLGVLALVVLAGLLRTLGVRARPLQDLLLLAVGLCGRALAHVDGERRTALRARWAALDLHGGRLAPLLTCDLVVVTQSFAIAFNVGVLAAMLLVWLPFEELRFGWQSTYSFTSAGVHAWVDAVAAPWHWIAASLAPDAMQVDVTRYARGQRADTLPADAAHAWWPFLLMAVATYGLMLRTLLAVVAWALLRRRLARVDVATPAANALWRRLAGPLVTSAGGDDRLSDEEALDARGAALGADLVLVDDELASRIDAIRAQIGRASCGPIGPVVATGIDDDALSDAILQALTPDVASIVVVVAASRDPIVAIAAFLRALSTTARRGCRIVVSLAGEPVAEGFAPVDPERGTIWKRFVAIQRLAVGVEGLA